MMVSLSTTLSTPHCCKADPVQTQAEIMPVLCGHVTSYDSGVLQSLHSQSTCATHINAIVHMQHGLDRKHTFMHDPYTHTHAPNC